MKTLIKTLLFFFLAAQFCLAQMEYSHSRTNLKYQNFKRPKNLENHYRDTNPYKQRMGENEIPISTHSGQMPKERQLDIVKNVLIDDFLVNDDVTDGSVQYNPSIAIDDSGNFVIVWEDWKNYEMSDPIYWNVDIYYQRYNSSGDAQGVNTKVNDDGSEDKWNPTIAMDSSGNFVIVWHDNEDIYYQRYNSSGEAQGVNIKANDDDVGAAFPWDPSIAIDDSGNFVILWLDEKYGNSDLYYQRYDSSGDTQGVNTKVNDAIHSDCWIPFIF